ncbi:pyridine nucleotide-disulfide oxidoreductase [Mycobacterium asiaticum]|uniref:Pyridine nucleotide-disulfide oxidoreductase n=1 Tax=Mycobacterium asiaticum TaxID=1790 RepID=A0A1A3NSV5_MYCAS|nr:FAD-dependent oxidoreductase [Mycobacterium asiaticum]OBK23397.1 pyridine nucleotide-disulfide oxidoreductase [Mycobacterium asiaticum]
MTSSSSFVIVGGGLAAAKAVEVLRDKNFDGHITLFADEEQLPYERPPLSKEYLAGKKTLVDFTVHDSDWYRDRHVDLRLNTRVESLDIDAHTVTAADGAAVAYDKLLLATGSASRRPSIPGSDAEGVHYLRSYADAVALNSILAEGVSLTIVGAGWIGLEVAASARQRGADVTVVESAQQPLLGALGAEVGQVFADLHREHGVDLRLGAQVNEISAQDDRVTGLTLADGSVVGADAVLVAVGAKPNIELAEQAGLELSDGGVRVDASLRTSDVDIYAVGDIAAADSPLFGTRIRTEHWATALKQPAVAVAGMLGESAEYDELPYFFTDQYDLGMEYAGHAPSYERVVFRGDRAGREFVAFWLDGDSRVLAGMNVNVWDVLDDVKALIRSRTPVDPEGLADPAIALDSSSGR